MHVRCCVPSWTWPMHISGCSNLPLVQERWIVFLWVCPKNLSSHIINKLSVWDFCRILLFIVCLILYKSSEISLKGWSKYRPRNPSSGSPWEGEPTTSLFLVYQSPIAFIAITDLVPMAQRAALVCLTLMTLATSTVDVWQLESCWPRVHSVHPMHNAITTFGQFHQLIQFRIRYLGIASVSLWLVTVKLS